MAKQTISLGTSANDGSGDPIRTAFGKVNDNFTELYTNVASLQNADNDLTAISSLTGTTGILKKVAADTWVLDNTSYLSSINSSQVVAALGYTPYNGATNTNGYLSSINSSQVVAALGYTPYNSSNPSGYLSSITSSQITAALGYTPYNSSNPNGYITTTGIPSQTGNSGKVLSTDGTNLQWVSDVDNYLTLSGLSVASTAASGSGSLSYNNTNGVFTFTPPNLSSYLTGITSSQITTALGYTPIQVNSLSITTNVASGGGSLSYSGGVFTYTPAVVPTLAVGVSDFLLNPTSTTLAAILSDESGTNKVAFTNSPVFVTPTLGVASATSLAINGGSLTINSSSGVSAPTWGVTGIGLVAPGATYTDTTSTGTVAVVEAVHSLNSPVIAATNATTFTSAATLYLGAPIAGANVTITNAYSLYATGAVSIGGSLNCTSNLNLSGTSSGTGAFGTSITSGSITIGTALSTGTLTIGGTAATGTMTFGQSTGAQTLNIGTGATLAATTKIINIGTAGVSTAITNINIGSAVSGSVTTLTLNGALAAASAITSAASAGYIGYPQNSTAVGITLALTDIGKHVYVSATGQTVTIPANATVAFPIGTEITIVGGPTATTTSIAITTDTLYLSPAGTTGTRTLAAYGIAKLLKVTSTSWYISGTGLT